MYKKIILASASPRRKELLSNIGLKFEVKPSLTDEHVEYFLNYGDYVKKLAERKAFSVYKDNKDYLVVASDTIVVIDDEILNKPKCETDAFNMLKKLSGREHVVYTSVCILDDENKISDYKATKVKFIELSDDEIKKYIATKEPLDKLF